MSVLLFSAGLPPESSCLVEEGQARSVIVIPDDPSPVVQNAAREISVYLARMSGAEVPVVAERDVTSPMRIDVGPTKNALRYLPSDMADNQERVLLKTVPEGVVICGGGDRGTMFAAWRFLESLGCRWLTADAQDEIVPQSSTIRVPVLNQDIRPAFEWRLFHSDSQKMDQWGMKLGFNGFCQRQTAVTHGGLLFWPSKVSGVHSYSAIMPTSRYFDTHPEWYALLRGQRDKVKGQLCVSAPGLADQFAANVIRIFDEDPHAELISISPDDGYNWCECDQCRRLDEQLSGGRTVSQGLSLHQPFVGDRVFWFSNQIAERVARVHPGRKLLLLAYLNYLEPPDTVRPASSLVPFVCHYYPADYSRPVFDTSSDANRQFNALLKRWITVHPDIMIYSYVSKWMWWRLPRPVLTSFAADIRYYHQIGIRRYYCQSLLKDWDLDGPLYYVIGRLLWDPNANPQEIAQEWIQGMFGPAAEEMTTFYEAVERSVRVNGKSFSDDPPGQVPGLYNAVEMDLALAALDRAAAVPCSEIIRGRIERVAETFRKGYWVAKTLEQDKLGDPASVAGITAVLYLTATVLCAAVWRQERRIDAAGQPGTPHFWMVMGVLLFGLWINRYVGLQVWLIELGRQLTQTQEWYQDRQIRKAIFYAVAGGTGIAAPICLWWLAHRQWNQNRLVLLSLVVLVSFFLVRALSFHEATQASPFHRFDAAFQERCAGCSIRWIVEFLSVGTAIIGAYRLLLKNRRRNGSVSWF